MDRFVKDPYLGVAKGIAFGNQENIEKEVKEKFINSGLIHIMVLSGANVSFIILLFFFLLDKIYILKIRFSNSGAAKPRRLPTFLFTKLNLQTKIIITTLASIAFIFLTGLTPPSVRAGVMVHTALFAEYFSKNFSIKNSILLSLFILTLINPFALVYSASLHLSYLAIFGLAFVAPKIYFLLNRFSKQKAGKDAPNFIQNESKLFLEIFRRNFWMAALSTFIGITLSIGPYLLTMSGKVNLLGTLANIFLEPIIMLVTIFSFTTTIASYISFFLAQIFGILNTFFVSIILLFVDFFSQDQFIFNYSLDPNITKIYYLFFLLYFIHFSNKKHYEI
jgi:competence protein ComEC